MPWTDRRPRQQRGYDKHWLRLRVEILKRDHGLCQFGLAMSPPRYHKATEVHHVRIPVGQPGHDDPDNLVSTCHACHDRATMAARGAKPKPRYDRNGYRISDDA